MNSDQMFKAFQEISKMQSEAIKHMDSGWTKIKTGYEHRGIHQHKRMKYLTSEPTAKEIEVLYSSAPFHNSHSTLIVVEPESGLWVLTLNVTLDSSD